MNAPTHPARRSIGTRLLLLAWTGLSLGLSPALETRATPAITVREALKQPEAWFRSEEGRHALTNVLSHQSSRGDWPKNKNTAAQQFTGDPNDIKGTFDNGATTGELRLLARAFNATQEERLRIAFGKGLDHILVAQYTNGDGRNTHRRRPTAITVISRSTTTQCGACWSCSATWPSTGVFVS